MSGDAPDRTAAVRAAGFSGTAAARFASPSTRRPAPTPAVLMNPRRSTAVGAPPDVEAAEVGGNGFGSSLMLGLRMNGARTWQRGGANASSRNPGRRV